MNTKKTFNPPNLIFLSVHNDLFLIIIIVIVIIIIIINDAQQTHAVPAHFAEKHRNQTARLGSSASLRCEAKGDHPLKILWKKMGAHLEQKLSDYRYTLKEENTTDGIISTLEFISTSREDSARYFCIASNAYGRDEMTIHLYIQGKKTDESRKSRFLTRGKRERQSAWNSPPCGTNY